MMATLVIALLVFGLFKLGWLTTLVCAIFTLFVLSAFSFMNRTDNDRSV